MTGNGVNFGNEGQREAIDRPELLLEATGGSDLLPLEHDVVAGGAAHGPPLTKRIGAIGQEDLLGTYEVVQGLGHLVPVLTQSHAVDENGIPGLDAHQGFRAQYGVKSPGADDVMPLRS